MKKVAQDHLIATWKRLNVMQPDDDVLQVSEPQHNNSPLDDFEASLQSRDARQRAEGRLLMRSEPHILKVSYALQEICRLVLCNVIGE